MGIATDGSALAERIADVAAGLPCYGGRMECRCDGCRASSALLEAYEMIEAEQWLEAYMSLSRADSALPVSDIGDLRVQLDAIMKGMAA
jgi:hypothetical protein